MSIDQMDFINSNEYFIAIVSEEPIPGMDVNHPNVITASCLLPPPAAKVAEIDGDAERFYEIYRDYLLSDVPVDFISLMLAYLHIGGCLIMMISCGLDEPWVLQLINHFNMYYGLSIGTKIRPFGFDQSYSDTINDILISGGYIKAYEYLAEKSPGHPINDYIMANLNAELHTILTANDTEYLSAALKVNPKATLAVTFSEQRRELQ
jgi:hypothetical protein